MSSSSAAASAMEDEVAALIEGMSQLSVPVRQEPPNINASLLRTSPGETKAKDVRDYIPSI